MRGGVAKSKTRDPNDTYTGSAVARVSQEKAVSIHNSKHVNCEREK